MWFDMGVCPFRPVCRPPRGHGTTADSCHLDHAACFVVPATPATSRGTHWAPGRPNMSRSKPDWAASALGVPGSIPSCREWRRLGVRQPLDLWRPGGVPVHRLAGIAAVHAGLRAWRRKQTSLRLDRDDRRSRRDDSVDHCRVGMGRPKPHQIFDLRGGLPRVTDSTTTCAASRPITWASTRTPVWCRG